MFDMFVFLWVKQEYFRTLQISLKAKHTVQGAQVQFKHTAMQISKIISRDTVMFRKCPPIYSVVTNLANMVKIIKKNMGNETNRYAIISNLGPPTKKRFPFLSWILLTKFGQNSVLAAFRSSAPPHQLYVAWYVHDLSQF